MLGRRRRGQRRSERIDPFGVGEPWRRFVQGALQAQARYQRVVGSVPAGPLRERLDGIARRIEQGTEECWRVAQHGDALDDVVSALDVVGTRVRMEAATSDAAEAGAADPTAMSLQAQIATAERMAAMVAEAREHLARLEAGLGQAVATAVELSARSAASADATVLSSTVDHLVDDLAAIRAALDETRTLG